MLNYASIQKQNRCNNCILPNNYEAISFNEKGVCNFCANHKKKIFKGEKSFVTDLDLVLGEKLGVTVSGGKDSIFAWYKLVNIFGAKNVIAFNHNKVGLVHPMAKENLLTAEKALGSELVIVEDFDFLDRFRFNFSNFLESPNPAIIKVALCMGCRFGIYGKMFQAGFERGVHKFVEAGSYLERSSFKVDLIKKIGEGNYLNGLLSCLDENPWCDRSQVEIDHENWRNPKLFKPKGFSHYDEVKCINFFHYFENNPFLSKEIVKKECSWKDPSNDWHFDCRIELVKELLFLSLLGYTENDCKISTMIRYNLISREEAKKQIEKKNVEIKASFEEACIFLEKLKLGHLINSFKKICYN